METGRFSQACRCFLVPPGCSLLLSAVGSEAGAPSLSAKAVMTQRPKAVFPGRSRGRVASKHGGQIELAPDRGCPTFLCVHSRFAPVSIRIDDRSATAACFHNSWSEVTAQSHLDSRNPAIRIWPGPGVRTRSPAATPTAGPAPATPWPPSCPSLLRAPGS